MVGNDHGLCALLYSRSSHHIIKPGSNTVSHGATPLSHFEEIAVPNLAWHWFSIHQIYTLTLCGIQVCTFPEFAVSPQVAEVCSRECLTISIGARPICCQRIGSIYLRVFLVVFTLIADYWAMSKGILIRREKGSIEGIAMLINICTRTR